MINLVGLARKLSLSFIGNQGVKIRQCMSYIEFRNVLRMRCDNVKFFSNSKSKDSKIY